VQRFTRTDEPILQFRFALNYSDLDDEMYCKSATLPAFTNGEYIVNHINSEIKLKGKTRWQPMTLGIYAFEDKQSGPTKLFTYLNNKHQRVDSADDFYGSSYKQDATLKLLKPDGESTAYEFKLRGAFIGDANWGVVDWSVEDPVIVEIIIKYDWCIVQ